MEGSEGTQDPIHSQSPSSDPSLQNAPPLMDPTERPTSTSALKNGLTLLLRLFAGIVIIFVLICVGIFMYISKIHTEKTTLPTNTEIPATDTGTDNVSQGTFESKKVSTGTSPETVTNFSKNIFNDALVYKKDTPAYISEVYWLNFVMKNAQIHGWKGTESDTLPVRSADIPSQLIASFRQAETNRNTVFTIPMQYEKYYFGKDAENTISQTIVTARNEFMGFLASKGVHSKYIDEINTNTLPNDGTRMFYHTANGVDADPTQSQGLMDSQGKKEDYSKLQTDYYSTDFYNHTRKIVDSGMLGPVPKIGTPEFDAYYLKAQQIGIRYLVYHEMGHILIKSVDSMNVPAEKKSLKSSWVWASKSVWKLDNLNYVHWSNLETLNNGNNITVSDESESEGMSYDALTTTIHMSDVQKKLLWEFLFGRLSVSRDEFDSALNILQQKYPYFDIPYIQQQIYKDIIAKLDANTKDTQLLYAINKRLSNLPAYQGYLHPRPLQDMSKLWNYLRD